MNVTNMDTFAMRNKNNKTNSGGSPKNLSSNLNIRKHIIRNDGSNLESLLKPQLEESRSTRFQTNNFLKYADLGHKQRQENLSVDQNDGRHVRRVMEITNKNSIRMAADVTNTMIMPKEIINRLKTYVDLKDSNSNLHHTRESLEKQI